MAKLGRRISKAELDAIHRRQFAEDSRRRVHKSLLGPDGKPINSRKRKGASKAIMLQTLVSRLYKDGFITKKAGESGMFVIDASDKIEKTYGAGSTSQDIRAVLIQLVNGFHVSGITVSVNGTILEGKKDDQKDSGDGPDLESFNETFSDVFGALRGGDPSEGWKDPDTEGVD